jgi:hypothetical protein
VELLAEMFAERRVGEANKLPLLLVLEAIKALLKIRMSATGYRHSQPLQVSASPL